MKKIMLLLVFVFVSTLVDAQDTYKKELSKQGDLTAVAIYDDNGVLTQEGFYNEEGTLQGTWTSYDVEGNKTAVAHYDNNKKVGTWYFYANDELKEVTYTDNKIAKVVTWKDNEQQIVSSY